MYGLPSPSTIEYLFPIPGFRDEMVILNNYLPKNFWVNNYERILNGPLVGSCEHLISFVDEELVHNINCSLQAVIPSGRGKKTSQQGYLQSIDLENVRSRVPISVEVP